MTEVSLFGQRWEQRSLKLWNCCKKRAMWLCIVAPCVLQRMNIDRSESLWPKKGAAFSKVVEVLYKTRNVVVRRLSVCCATYILSETCSCMLSCKDGFDVDIPPFTVQLCNILMFVCVCVSFNQVTRVKLRFASPLIHNWLPCSSCRDLVAEKEMLASEDKTK